MSAPVACVIMAGGSGERLWPLVRGRQPKVCLSVGGQTLLGTTLRRMRPWTRTQKPWVITTAAQAQAVRRIVPRGGAVVIAEPQPRNTAACVALAAAAWARRDPETVLILLPADHWIEPAAAFHRSVRAAVDAARATDRLVTIGVRPSRVHSGLGHLCTGRVWSRSGTGRVWTVARFIEKPEPRRAQQLLRQPGVFWNTGVFVGRASVILSALRRHAPKHVAQLEGVSAWAESPDFSRRAARAYRRLPAVSFDNGVMVRLRQTLMVEGAFRWEDLGSWDSWARMSKSAARTVTLDGDNVRVVSADHHLIATVGMGDMIVVHTPDATLVCRADDAQAVRRVVGHLSRQPALARYL